MLQVSPVFVTLVGLYCAVVIALSVWSGLRTRGLGDYLTAGRSIGAIVGGAAFAATQMSAGTFVGTLGIHYLTGSSFAWIWPGLWCGWIIQAVFVAPKFATFGGKTVPEYVRLRYGSRLASRISALLILVAYTVYLTAQYQAGGAIFHTLFGLPAIGGILITIGITVLFVLVGGMRATAYTDFVHALIMVGCFVAAVPLVLSHLSAAQIGATLTSLDPRLTGWFYGPKNVIGFMLAFGLSTATAPYELARQFTMRDVRTVRLAIGWSFVFQALVGISVAFVGMSMRVFFPNLSTPDVASTVFSIDVVPPVVGGLVMIAIIGAIMSVVSGIMMVSGAALAHDLLQDLTGLSDRAELWLTRAVILLLGCVPILLALQRFALVQFVVLLQASLVASFFFATVVVGLNWSRATPAGAIASMLIGFGVAIVWFAVKEPLGLDPVVPGVATSLVAFFAVSAFTRAPGREALARFFPKPPIAPAGVAAAVVEEGE